MSERIMILGSSHSFALIQGIDSTFKHQYLHKHLGDFCPGSRIVLPIDGGWEDYHLRPDFEAWLDTELDADRIVLSISGSDWLQYSLAQRAQPLDLILPYRQDLPDIRGTYLIPYAELRNRLRHHIRHIVLGIELIRKRVRQPIVYLHSPWPIEDNEFIARTADFWHTGMDNYGVTPPLLRLKLYLLHAEIVAEACANNGVTFLPAPDTARTPEEFLLPECVGSNFAHANARYGYLAMKDFEARYG